MNDLSDGLGVGLLVVRPSVLVFAVSLFVRQSRRHMLQRAFAQVALLPQLRRT